MCWVAFDRLIRMARDRGRPGDVQRWTGARDAIYQQIMDKCWNPQRRAFTQYPGTDVLDAISLLMPLVGFIPPKDHSGCPRSRESTKSSLPTASSTATTQARPPTACRDPRGPVAVLVLYVDALARAGRLEEARYAFEKMLTYSNHVGLYSEEIDRSGRQIGNFPQAFTHLALVHAAIDLDAALNVSAGEPLELLGGLGLPTVPN